MHKRAQIESMNNASSQIECIGQEPVSKENQKQLPVYRAYGYQGKWSGPFLPPALRSRVKINFNGLGSGEVLSYFSESGFLGIRVKLDKEPNWRKKQSAAGKPAMIFGSEITPL